MNGYTSFNPNTQTGINTDYLKEQYPDFVDPTQIPIVQGDTNPKKIQDIQNNTIQNNDKRLGIDEFTNEFIEDFLDFKKAISQQPNTYQNSNNNTAKSEAKNVHIPISIDLVINIKVNQI